jgi:Na+-transporting NADH:ubiquinone oxidoreductase subunit B
MKFIRDFMDKIEPDKKKSPFFHTLWDGIDTFLFAPASVTKVGTHIKDGMDLKRTMVHVVIAMQLAFIAGMINIGHQHYLALGMYPGLLDGFLYKFAYGFLQYLPPLIVVHVVGLGIEFYFAAKKGHAIEEGFLVSGFLIPLIMPPSVPLWILALATAFAVIVAKEAFGGTGMNILNVALVARVFVFFAYPATISGDEVWVAYEYNFLHQLVGLKAHTVNYFAEIGYDFNSFFTEAGKFIPNASPLIDGWTGATPMALAAYGGWDAVQSASYSIFNANGELVTTAQQYGIGSLIFGNIPGSVGEMNKLAVLVGVLILVGSGIGSWRIMLSLVMGAAFASILLNVAAGVLPEVTNPFITVPWYYQFMIGSLLFAMAFMATDPVTASATNTGKWIYGFMIGVMGIIIRVTNPAYPEGWMLAILLINVFAPLFDHIVIQQNIKRRLSRA